MARRGRNGAAASHVVLYDRWWNPAVEDQARDRAWRIGQTRTVVSHRLVCPGTVDERVEEVVAGKRHIADLVLPKSSSIADLDARPAAHGPRPAHDSLLTEGHDTSVSPKTTHEPAPKNPEPQPSPAFPAGPHRRSLAPGPAAPRARPDHPDQRSHRAAAVARQLTLQGQSTSVATTSPR